MTRSHLWFSRNSRIGRRCYHLPPFQERTVRLSPQYAHASHYPVIGRQSKERTVGLHPGCLSLHAFPSLKEVDPVEIGVCVQSGYRVSPDGYISEQLESVLFCPKHPVSVPFPVPVSPGYPFVPFIRMSMFTPLPGNCPYIAVKEPECPLGCIVAMVVGPTPDNRIQGKNQAVLCPGLCLSDNRCNLFRDRLD